jgi:hypothetical protein
MGEKLISEGDDILENSFEETGISIIIFGDPEFTSKLSDNPELVDIDMQYFEPLDFEVLFENKDRYKTSQNLFFQTSNNGAFIANVRDDKLQIIIDELSYMFSNEYVQMHIQYTSFVRYFQKLPKDMLDLFSIIEMSAFRVPMYYNHLRMEELFPKSLDLQMFNFPTLGEYSDNSMASLYGIECDWKHVENKDRDNFVSALNTWWRFTSQLILKNRIQYQPESKSAFVKDLAEQVSLNTYSIVDMSWEIAKIKQNLEDSSGEGKRRKV